jgi:hypothetical protein
VRLHDTVKALVVNRLQAYQSACAIDQRAGTAVAIRWQCRDFGPYCIGQDRIAGLVKRLRGAAVDSVLRSRHQQAHVGARHAQSRTDRLHWSSLPNKGERAIH